MTTAQLNTSYWLRHLDKKYDKHSEFRKVRALMLKRLFTVKENLLQIKRLVHGSTQCSVQSCHLFNFKCVVIYPFHVFCCAGRCCLALHKHRSSRTTELLSGAAKDINIVLCSKLLSVVLYCQSAKQTFFLVKTGRKSNFSCSFLVWFEEENQIGEKPCMKHPKS